MRILKAALLYFAIVFGAGFVLGTIRTLWIVPRIGARGAELMETPIMFVVVILAARVTVRWFLASSARTTRLAVGFIALLLMLVAEFGFVLWLRGISIRQYLATRDPISATAYYLMLGVFAIMPLLAGKAEKG